MGLGKRTGMKILVADDHPLYREAVRVQIERLFDDVSVFEVPTLEEASALASGPEAPFDLFLIDFSMPGMSLAALSQLTRSHPDVPIAVISGTADAGDVRATIQAGARGFIPRPQAASTSRMRSSFSSPVDRASRPTSCFLSMNRRKTPSRMMCRGGRHGWQF